MPKAIFFESAIYLNEMVWYFIAEISLVVFMPNITTNHAITYTNRTLHGPACERYGSAQLTDI